MLPFHWSKISQNILPYPYPLPFIFKHLLCAHSLISRGRLQGGQLDGDVKKETEEKFGKDREIYKYNKQNFIY